MARLNGKTALVTGAGQGIGRAVACALADEGAAVRVSDLNPDSAAQTTQIITQAGNIANAVTLDVTSESDWHSLAASIGDGALDILVHNAGMEWVVPLDQIELSDWRKVMSVNV